MNQTTRRRAVLRCRVGKPAPFSAGLQSTAGQRADNAPQELWLKTFSGPEWIRDPLLMMPLFACLYCGCIIAFSPCASRHHLSACRISLQSAKTLGASKHRYTATPGPRGHGPRARRDFQGRREGLLVWAYVYASTCVCNMYVRTSTRRWCMYMHTNLGSTDEAT